MTGKMPVEYHFSTATGKREKIRIQIASNIQAIKKRFRLSIVAS
jgi:hypothetical protein